MKKMVSKVTKITSKSKSVKRKSNRNIEKVTKSTKNSKLNNQLNRDQNQSIGNKKSKPKHNKWKFGIIVKQKTKIQTQNMKNKQKNKKKRNKNSGNLFEKGTITRSVARRLIDKNMLDLDQEYLAVKPQRNRILNDDVLKLVFGYLPLKDRFRIQRTSKQFYAVVQEMLSEQRAFRIGNIVDYYMNCKNVRHSTLNANIEDAISKKYFYKYFYMNDITASKEMLGNILWKCPNIRCLELHNFNIDVETVKWLKWHSPNIECLRLDEIKYDLTARKWSQIGQTLGDRLIHLNLDANSIHNDITNLVQHLPLLEEFRLSKYELPMPLLMKRLSSNITSLSLTECARLDLDSIKALMNNKQIVRNLINLELHTPSMISELDNTEIFSMVCKNFTKLRDLWFQCLHRLTNIAELTNLKELRSLELRFIRDCFLDLNPIESCELTALRSLTIHGAFFRPKMIELIGQKFPNCERLRLTNWAFCCGCPNNDGVYDEYDCPDCDDKCCQALLKMENMEHLFLEFLYSSDYIKPLILSLLTFEKLHTVTLVWYPVNTSINTINFINAIINYGVSMANKQKKKMIRFQFEKYVIALIDASKQLPKNLSIRAIN